MTEWLTIKEAAAKLIATEENVRRMVWSGRLAGEQIDGTSDYRVSARSVEKLLASGAYVPGMTQPSD